MNPEDTVFIKCNFDTECDFCIEPKKGTYSRNKGSDDDFYWICGKCFDDFSIKNPKADNYNLLKIIDESQHKLDIRLPF